MDKERQNKWRSFLLAFTLTLVLLSAIMIATVMAVQPSMPQTDRTRSGDEFTFRPQAADTLTMAVIGLGADGPGEFLLIRFNPQYGQVPLTLLPPEAIVTLEGANMTLREAYQKGGGNTVKAALSERLGVAVDKYAVLKRDAFIRIADTAGSVVYELPYDIIYQKDGFDINLGAGKRRLDGQDIANMFAYPGYESPQEKSKVLGGLVAEIVNQNLSAAGEEISSGLFKLAVNLIDTDITYADYEYRRSAADFVAKLDTQVAGNLPLQGTFLEDGINFELAEKYVQLIRQYFQAVG